MSARKSILATLTVLALLLAVLPPAAGAAPALRSAASGQEGSWLGTMLAEAQAFLSHLLILPTGGTGSGKPAIRLQCDNTGAMDPDGRCHNSAAPPVRPITPQCDNTGMMDPNGLCHNSAAPPVRPITPQCDNTGTMDPDGRCHS